MATIGSLIGTAGGAGGTGFSGPAGAPIVNPTNPGQISTAYTGVQNAQAQQGSLLQALQAQNGLQNQSQVYNQLQGVVNGTGPNPAQAQLAQATGQNVANQAALMAGQRGSSANVGLLARQAAQQGAQTQQQAAGQAATLQAQQSLNALGQAGGIAGTQAANQIGQTNANTSAQQAEQAALMNAQLGVNTSNVGMQSNINSVNGQLANTQLQGQQAMLGGLMQGIGGGASSVMSALAEGGEVDDSPALSPTSDSTPAPADEFKSNDESVNPGAAPNTSVPSFGSDAGASALAQGMASMGGSKSGGGGGGGGGGIMGLLALMADGGSVPDLSQPVQQGPQSNFGKFLKGAVKPTQPGKESEPNYGNPGANTLSKGASALGSSIGGALKPSTASQGMAGGPSDAGMPQSNTLMAAKGGKVPALVSPGEQYLPPKDVYKVKQGANPLTVGERIPGKPKHPGNDYRNDVVPKTLEAGGIVIPNKVMQAKNPHFEAMKFVHAHIAKNRGGLPKKAK
jgi:hypothetical protein